MKKKTITPNNSNQSKKMTLRYYQDDQLVLKYLTPQMIEDSNHHGLSLVAEDTLPANVYLFRSRSPRDMARFINMPADNYLFDEDNESSDDYLKYCLLALEAELDPDEKRMLKKVILNYRYDDVNYFRWWQSSYQFDFVNIIRRVNDTNDTINETLKRIQGFLRDQPVAHDDDDDEEDEETVHIS